jgi:AICAR transformylase/IMP cyclohydrolase PurH
MGFDTVRWFKVRSKKLLKAIRAGDEAARERVRKHVRNMNRLHLQKIQFVVVRECGFESWKAMLDASEEQRLNAIELAKVRDGEA